MKKIEKIIVNSLIGASLLGGSVAVYKQPCSDIALKHGNNGKMEIKKCVTAEEYDNMKLDVKNELKRSKDLPETDYVEEYDFNIQYRENVSYVINHEIEKAGGFAIEGIMTKEELKTALKNLILN